VKSLPLGSAESTSLKDGKAGRSRYFYAAGVRRSRKIEFALELSALLNPPYICHASDVLTAT